MTEENTPEQKLFLEENQGFDRVILALKTAHYLKAWRAGWNGKGIYIGYMAQLAAPQGQKQHLPYLYIDTTGVDSGAVNPAKGIVPWLASQTDLLADDWTISNQ